MTATLRLTLEDGVSKGLAELARTGAHPRSAMARIGVILEGSTVERFDTGTAPDGTPWKPSFRAKGGFDVAYGKARKDGTRRTRPAGAGKTLVDQGHLRGSITSVADDDSVEVGSNLIYAAVHQFGATITAKNAKALKFSFADGRFAVVKSVTIPARPYLGISAEDELDILDVVNDELAKAAAA